MRGYGGADNGNRDYHAASDDGVDLDIDGTGHSNGTLTIIYNWCNYDVGHNVEQAKVKIKPTWKWLLQWQLPGLQASLVSFQVQLFYWTIHLIQHALCSHYQI